MNKESQNKSEPPLKKSENAFSSHYSKMRSKREIILEEPIAFPIMKRLSIIAISFFIPIAGFIIYIVQLDDNPKEAKYAGIFTLIGFTLNMIILALWLITALDLEGLK